MRTSRCTIIAFASGFSLLEMLIVLSLMAIVASISVVSHSAMRPQLDLSAAARQVVMDLKVVRMRAVTDNVNHRLLFTPGAAGYRRQRMSGAAYVDEGPPVPLPSGIAVTQCTATGDAVTYRPRGNASTFGTLTLQNSKGETRRVVVDIAGRIRVQ